MLELRHLARSRRRNQCWISPAGFAPEPPHDEAPVYAMPASALRDGLRDIIAAEPRITWGKVSTDGLRFDLVQRSRLFGFPDDIAIEILPLGPQQSTLAIYSRAKYGLRDYGVNRQRVKRWLAASAHQVAVRDAA